LRVLFRCGVGWRCEECREGRFELGLRVGLALLGVKKAWAVDQAGVAGSEQIRAVVAEVEPCAAIRQVLVARALDQLLQIAGLDAG
jgi:hypothetical protein